MADKRKMQSAESRRRVLMAGMAVFAQKGYAGSSVRDIVGRIGCSVNAISNHFGSKEDLATAVVMALKETIVTPVASNAEQICSDYAWSIAMKRFARQVVDLFLAKDEPNCYFASLYRRESADLRAKKVTLHEEIVKPMLHQLEGLVSLGVPDGDRMTIRLRTLSLWHGLLAYALNDPDVIAEAVPEGVDASLFREAFVDFMVDRCIGDLKFNP